MLVLKSYLFEYYTIILICLFDYDYNDYLDIQLFIGGDEKTVLGLCGYFMCGLFTPRSRYDIGQWDYKYVQRSSFSSSWRNKNTYFQWFIFINYMFEFIIGKENPLEYDRWVLG
jgi:hypothetical protein